MRVSDLMHDVNTIKRRFDNTLMVGGVAGASIGVASLLGLPVPTAIGVGAIIGGHVTGALFDLYKMRNFKSTYDRFMELIEKREVILRVVKNMTSAIKQAFNSKASKHVKALDNDIAYYGNQLGKLVDRKMREVGVEEKVQMTELKDKIDRAIRRKTSLTEGEQQQLDEALAPIILTVRLMRKLKDDTETKRHLTLLRDIFNDHSDKYTSTEVMEMLLGDFVRDYRRGLLTADEFVVTITSTVSAIEKNDPSILLTNF